MKSTPKTPNPPGKETGDEMASLAGRILRQHGKCEPYEAAALAACVLSQREVVQKAHA